MTIPQAHAVRPQRRLIIGEVDVAYVIDNPPSDLKPANGRISATAFDEPDRASVHVSFYIPEDDTRVTINLVSVISVEISVDDVAIVGYWDVHVNGQLFLDNDWGRFDTGYTRCGLDVGGFSDLAKVKIKGTVTLYK